MSGSVAESMHHQALVGAFVMGRGWWACGSEKVPLPTPLKPGAEFNTFGGAFIFLAVSSGYDHLAAPAEGCQGSRGWCPAPIPCKAGLVFSAKEARSTARACRTNIV